ncbi:rhodanese-like domain-containing protein [Rhizobium sp. BK376]|uniref:rhodanese-like domain-containing protein n=1 Tax=Rhizobium sp. BK376 TaxID=2512149 RepID=UPI00104C48E5|nr:rhodanese-like domain-containing protein [Rhizobium sp. BK376]TCR91906.1 rhodanese-related sulfurtransferase [Rhizobium sp. BK376]
MTNSVSKSPVSEAPAANPQTVADHFARKLAFETDCSDVNAAFAADKVDFVLLDVRSPALFALQHVPGAINLPHGKMTAHRMSQWPADTLFVVYCAGPHCNGADKAALRLSRLGLSVKLMIGGLTGWADEGYTFASGVETAA